MTIAFHHGNRYLSNQGGVSKTYFPIRGWTLSKEDAEKQTEKSIDEQGFYFDYDKCSWFFRYPTEFTTPCEDNNDKYIIFQYCRCTVNDHFHSEIEVHASFIPRDKYCDSLVYYANLQVPDDNRKYKVNTNKLLGFEVWFSDGMGRRYSLNNPISPPDINFVMFLKLEY